MSFYPLPFKVILSKYETKTYFLTRYLHSDRIESLDLPASI